MIKAQGPDSLGPGDLGPGTLSPEPQDEGCGSRKRTHLKNDIRIHPISLTAQDSWIPSGTKPMKLLLLPMITR